MKRNHVLFNTIILLSFFLFLTEPISLALPNMAHIPEKPSVNLSASGEWISYWSRFDDKDDVALDVVIDTNDDVIVGGFTTNTTIDQFVAKFDETGVQLWNHTRDGGSQDWFIGLAVAGTDIYVGNHYLNQSSLRYECFLGKYDGLGNNLWNVSWFKLGATGCYARNMALSQTGTIYFIGEMAYGSSPSYTYQYFILKLDSSGNEVWNITFGTKDQNRKNIDGIATFDDLIYVTGQEYNQARSEKDPLIACFNSTTGYQLWNLTWDDSAYINGVCEDIIVDSSGNFYGTGYYGMDYNRLVFLRKYSPSRVLLWESTYKDISSWAQGIALENNENIYISGATKEIHSESSALLLKFALNGTLLGVGSWEGNNTGYNIGFNVGVDSSGNVYMVGKTPGISFNDAFIIKNLELTLPSEGSGGGGDAIPGFNLWILIGLFCFLIPLIRKRHFSINK